MGSTLRRILDVLLALVILALAPRALAEDARPADAQAAFDRAVELAKTGDTCAAAKAFRESYELHKARDTLNGLALAEEECGQLTAAYNHFVILEELAKSASDSRRAQIARQGIDRLAPKVAKLIVNAPSGASVFIDGKEYAGDAPVVLDPGEHSVRAVLDEREATKTIDVQSGATEEVTLELPEATGDDGVELGTLEVIGIAVAGLGVLGIVSGSVLYASAGSQFDEVAAKCPDNICPAEVAADIESGEQEEVAGQVLLGLGITMVLAGAGILTWSLFIDDGEASATLHVGPGGLGIEGRF